MSKILHNKNVEILIQFLGNYDNEIYGRQIVSKVSLSQKAIALALDELEKEAILKSRVQGNIRYFKLNLENPEVKDVILEAEIVRKTNFLRKHRKLAHIFKRDNRVVGIFGSYAKGSEKPTSDIDLFVIGNRIKEDYDSIGKTFDLNISIKYFSETDFRKLAREKTPYAAK